VKRFCGTLIRSSISALPQAFSSFSLSNGGVLQINIGLFGNQRLLASWNGQPRD
jgi:hypothetical protein